MNYKNRLNPNLDKIAVSAIRQFDQEVSKVPGIQKLTLGEPDFFTPEHVKSAGIKAISDNKSHYTHNAGLIELRRAISDFYRERYGLTYQADSEIITTVGVTEAIATVFFSLIVPGDQVLIPAPAYPGYAPSILLQGGEVTEIDTRENAYLLSPELLEKALRETPNVKALVLNYPGNPTGVTYTRAQLAALAEVIKHYDLFVVADEVYSELTYTAEGHRSIAEFLPEQTIVLNGLSKSHAMTGWRMGYILAKAELIAEFTKTHQYLVTAATTAAQYAALEALTKGQDDPLEMKKAYLERRDYIINALSALGFGITPPSGAFYIFAKLPGHVKLNSYDFLLDFAQKKGFAFIPGSAFGQFGEGYIRISYAASMAVIKMAMAALGEYMGEID